MERAELFHPIIFNDPKWASGYYKRNKKSIEKVGKRLAKELRKAGFEKGNILDAGCGFASVSVEIAKEFPEAKITGIDLGEPLLDIGQSIIKDQGLENQITLQKGDALNLQFKDNSFDVVINTFLVHIVENPVQMLNEIERVTKSDGKIIITDLRRGLLAYLIKTFRTAFTPEEALVRIRVSKIRKCKLTTGLFWWDYKYL